MNKFLFKSTDADFKKMFSNLQQQLDVISSNVLYMTHNIDTIRKAVLGLNHDKDLQDTVDKYFDKTSQQTDSDEQ